MKKYAKVNNDNNNKKKIHGQNVFLLTKQHPSYSQLHTQVQVLCVLDDTTEIFNASKRLILICHGKP